MRLDDKVASVTGTDFGFGKTTPEMRPKFPATIPIGWRMRKRPAARSFLIPLGGRTTHAVGLGALVRKRPAARSFLISLGGRTTHAVGLGALAMPGDFGHVACFPRSDEASMVAGAVIGVGGGRGI